MKKKINIILALLFIICFVGVTFAYYSYSKTFNNNFDVGDFNVVIEENFDEGACIGDCYDEESDSYEDILSVDKEVFIVNKETTDAIVRISYNEYCDVDSANAYKVVSSNIRYGTDYIIKGWTQSFYDDWVYYEGWYYYKKVLLAGEQTQVLENVELLYNWYCSNYNLDFNIEAIQADATAVEELWNKEVTINTDGSVEWGFDTNDEDE